MHVFTKGAALAVLGGLLASSASAVVFDDFTSGAQDLQIVTGTGTIEGQANGTMIGTQRDVLLNMTANPFNRNLDFAVVPGQGASFLSSGPGVVGTVSLDYDGVDNEGADGFLSPGPGLALNLSDQNAFAFNFLFADSAINIHILAQTFNADTSISSSSLDLTQASTFGPSTTFGNFASFGNQINGGVNFGKVDRVVVTFAGTDPASDFALANFVTAAPEPISCATIGIGLIGLLARRRRRKV